jgi:hypothetical protein
MTDVKIPAMVIALQPGLLACLISITCVARVLSEFFNGVRAAAVRQNIRCHAA